MSQTHLPCPDCDSSDALLINDDGSTKCFSCGTFTPSKEGVPQVSQKDVPKDFLKGVAKNIDARCLKQETCRKYKYNTGTYKGKEIQIATYRDLEGNPVFQKIRFVEDEKLIQFFNNKPEAERKGYIFINPETGLPYKDIKKAWSTALKKARIENFRFHDLRHTVGTRLAEQLVPVNVIKELLGHSDVHTTMRYVHSTLGAKLQALNKLNSYN